MKLKPIISSHEEQKNAIFRLKLGSNMLTWNVGCGNAVELWRFRKIKDVVDFVLSSACHLPGVKGFLLDCYMRDQHYVVDQELARFLEKKVCELHKSQAAKDYNRCCDVLIAIKKTEMCTMEW